MLTGWPRYLPLFLLLAACARPAVHPDADFSAAIGEIEQRVGGVIGVYALDTGSGRELAWRADRRFAMASTFKVVLVAAVLADVDMGRLSLSDELDIGAEPIVSHSPVTGALTAGERISVAALCDAAITQSDNTAANRLLRLVGGPAGLTRFLRAHGDESTRLDRYEVELNSNLRHDERDTTTPRAMVASLRRFLLAGALSSASQRQLQDWMVASLTGSARLRAGLPTDWRIGDKTGTGANGAVNDVAIAWPPGKSPIIIAVYMSGSEAGNATLSAAHADIATLVADRFRISVAGLRKPLITQRGRSGV